jgi:hypothetical protein
MKREGDCPCGQDKRQKEKDKRKREGDGVKGRALRIR